MNSQDVKREHVIKLIIDDGFGPYEALDHVDTYCKVLTGTKPSKTLRARVRRWILSTMPKQLRHGEYA